MAAGPPNSKGLDGEDGAEFAKVYHPLNGLLVRVGADLSEGGGRWNGPVNTETGQFCYVPIPETKPTRAELGTTYEAVHSVLEEFSVKLPPHLKGAQTHLDPDFEHLTYGDRGKKGQQLQRNLVAGDIIVFYAGLRDCIARKLVYGIIGLFVVDDVVPISRRAAADFHKNAHTRRLPREPHDDVVVVGRPGESGRASRCVPIGEFRSRAYRVTAPLLTAWGGLSVTDGFLQRSAVFPSFLNAERFLQWWNHQGIDLVSRNN